MSQQSKREKRKEQNRRAQASYRKRKQQRLQFLEQHLGFVENVASSSTEQSDFDFAAEDVQAHSQVSHYNQLGQRQAFPVATTFPSLEQKALEVFPPSTRTTHSSSFAKTSLHATYANQESSLDLSWSDSVSSSSHCPNLDASTLASRCSYNRPACYTFDALASNAKLLGYPNEALIKATSGSKFFSPLSVLDNSSIPEPFRPTMAQLTYDHHPYIDCIPLPDLRSRMVLALSHKPPLIPHLELFFDVLSGGVSSGPDPQDGSQWFMKEDFAQKWKLLSCDTGILLAQTLSSNPPMRIVVPPNA